MFNSRLNEAEFLDFMMADFGITCESQLKSRILIKLNQWLLGRRQQGQWAVLIVDEASLFGRLSSYRNGFSIRKLPNRCPS
jgi:hypothetical protein